MAEETILEIIKHYLAELDSVGIHAQSAVLFGSLARGDGNENSDIDLIVIAPEFDNCREITLVKNLWKATVVDSRIEPVPCGEKEWQADKSRPILEIARREGVVVAA